MPFVAPRTWLPDQVVTATQMNEISTSLAYLLAPHSWRYIVSSGTTVSAPSILAAAVIPSFSFGITTYGGHMLIGMRSLFTQSDATATNAAILSLMLNGVVYEPMHATRAGYDARVNTTAIIRNLAAGSHTIAIGWHCSHSGYTMTLNHTFPNTIVWGIEL